MRNKEIWKDIPGFEGYYQASNLGRIRSLDRSRAVMSRWQKHIEKKHKGKVLDFSKKISGSGYYNVVLSINGLKYYKTVHRLIAMTFKGDGDGLQVNHIDENKLNNKVDNLEWVTGSQNKIHSIHRGNHNTVKLSPSLVKKIRIALDKGVSSRVISNFMGVHSSTVHRIKNRKIWKTI